MTNTRTTENITPPDPSTAVLYVCAEQGRLAPNLTAERAEEEGRAFAIACGLRLAGVVTDAYGEPDPCRRSGWSRIRDLAEAGTVDVVIARWPASISPDPSHEMWHREIQWLQDRGVEVCYSWPPLATSNKARGTTR
ncbi:recombinase family protein [Streptomyces sp. 769]|uniref:recombinase family protein n=1 Tax=Streptomyces sp. 769 TaxID=1262452 RepID=UPI000581F098|nr:recombinase family protein [Streptomyces sp. 769]AJC61971.1 hypothetical protein GZL_p00041 [Streptomyces sp. 769]